MIRGTLCASIIYNLLKEGRRLKISNERDVEHSCKVRLTSACSASCLFLKSVEDLMAVLASLACFNLSCSVASFLLAASEATAAFRLIGP